VALVRLGKIVRAVGLQGFVGVAGAGESLGELGWVVLRRSGGREEEEPREVLEARRQGRLWAVRLEGVQGREAAEALVGTEVLAPREDLGEAGEGLHYWADLEGLAVVTVAGEDVGRVTGFYETGGVDVLVVTKGGREALVPLAPYVTVDSEAGKVIVDPPEGLLDLDEAGRSEKGGPKRGD
jgi:16S rRNA processing protein RimM